MAIKRGCIFIIYLLFVAKICSGQKIVSQSALFSTNDPQSMWGPGDAPGLNDTITIFPQFRPGPYDFDTSPFTILDVEGLEFGAALFGLIDFGVGPFTFEIGGFTAGEIEIEYPSDITLEMPDDGSFNSGETIRIKSDFGAGAGAELLTQYPASGTIKLGLDLLFDAEFGFEVCFVDCAPRLSVIPPPFPPPGGGSWPKPLLDEELIFFQLNIDSLVYLCNDPLNGFQCVENFGPPWNLTDLSNADIPLTIEASLPYVETNSMIQGRNLLATGDSTYVTNSLDLIKTMSYLPVVGAVIGRLDDGVEINILPDITGTVRGISINWTLIGLSLVLPLTHNQEFEFVPRTFTRLEFPDTVQYAVYSHRNGSVTNGRGPFIEYEVGDSVDIEFPCQYDFMDVRASHSFKGEISNKTFDNIGLELDMTLFEFSLMIDRFVIFPEICIPIPFTDDLCTPELAFPETTIPIDPLFENTFTLVPNIDFPPYFNNSWEVNDFNSVVIDEPFRLTPRPKQIDFITQDVFCFGDSTGSIQTNFANASETVTYEWSFGATGPNPSNVPAGLHNVKITDGNRCVFFEEVEIFGPQEIKAQVSATPIDCNANAQADITVTATGGAGNLTYLWNTSDTGPSLTGMPAGFYEVTISDNNGCSIIKSITIEEPSSLRTQIFNVVEPSCANGNDGSLELFVEGGVPPYTFQWSNGGDGQSIDEISAGNYVVVVTDGKGCTKVDSYNLSEPTGMMGTIVKQSDVSCFAGEDGALSVQVQGGTPPYNYSWLNDDISLGITTPTIENLVEGNYSVEVLDDLGCRIVITDVVFEPASPLKANLFPAQLSCQGASDGAIDLIPEGGTPPYRYQWSNGATTQDLENLTEGVYEVLLIDANECNVGTKTVIITPDEVQAFVFSSDISCSDQQDGRIEITRIIGGTPPYDINWSTGGNGNMMIEDLAVGTYEVTVTDALGCSFTSSNLIGKREGDCLFIPNTFSPNGDGTNDDWNIRNISLYPDARVRVFNRWGIDVFLTEGYNRPWDGTYNGKVLEPGTYYYVVDLQNGSPEYKGPLTILQ